MWYRKSNDFMSGIIPDNKGAENAPFINDDVISNDPYEGATLESALDKVRSPESCLPIVNNSNTPTIHKSNNSAQIEDAMSKGPGQVPYNKGNFYSV